MLLHYHRCLGFGSSRTIAMPENRFLRTGTKEYRYNIQQLSKSDVGFLNSLLIQNTDQFFGYANADRVKYSMAQCNIVL